VKISVVLATYQRADLLSDQLEALAAQDDDGAWELVVVDNGSTDATLAVVESFRSRVPELRVVVATDLHCPSYAMNAGAREATGDAFVFLNDDDVVTPGYVAAMRRGLERHPAVAARVDWKALNPPWTLTARGRHQVKGLVSWWFGGPELAFSAGGTLGSRRDAHDAVGGFDESFVAAEDVDYCWRLNRAGLTVHHLPDAVVCLRNRDTLLGIYRQARSWGEADVHLFRKHGDHLPRIERPLRRGLAGWAGAIMLLARARDRKALADAVRHIGWRVGLVRGSLKHRALMLSD
jgi:GT2 family glycosyltransferase